MKFGNDVFRKPGDTLYEKPAELIDRVRRLEVAADRHEMGCAEVFFVLMMMILAMIYMLTANARIYGLEQRLGLCSDSVSWIRASLDPDACRSLAQWDSTP